MMCEVRIAVASLAFIISGVICRSSFICHGNNFYYLIILNSIFIRAFLKAIEQIANLLPNIHATLLHFMILTYICCTKYQIFSF